MVELLVCTKCLTHLGFLNSPAKPLGIIVQIRTPKFREVTFRAQGHTASGRHSIEMRLLITDPCGLGRRWLVLPRPSQQAIRQDCLQEDALQRLSSQRPGFRTGRISRRVIGLQTWIYLQMGTRSPGAVLGAGVVQTMGRRSQACFVFLCQVFSSICRK